ncbi:TetR family transcriptional regulator [Amycolatopsis sp. SID8362]|uniref:TetR/AcrR family transcriptional regulator n=1 Tax=Amycolatopsis sp. SID8362 TaxID=2690346 RepID=UPI00136D2A7B|nr:TetR family transcriptional regulator [Amycolatopsis sp. SID8362]NBH12486.1 TetR family transcriptional regulator [Amycolatopsis sp. SID8362]NED49178.1 TetR family transcriptional regulator [Amycolatopsis sp. SID8362]
MSAGFQRARRPEQIEARRTAILAAAREMLGQRPVAEISLRELSCHVGLAKSNVLRYFDSREAIFLEVLDGSWSAWLDELAFADLPVALFERENQVAGTIASTLAERRLLCELISAMAPVLERNISLDFARGFKHRAAANLERLASLVRAGVPELSADAARVFARAVVVVVSGAWPYANPTEAVALATAEAGGAPGFEAVVAENLTNLLAGLVARGR